MPNHIINKVQTRISGSPATMKKVVEFVKGENGDFDFNKIRPMPKELEKVTCPTRIVSQKEYDKEIAERAEKEKTQAYWSHSITLAMSKRFKKLYGADNWYDWALKNWGTKWNAYDITISGSTIEFQTAWSTPLPVIAELSEKFPDIEFLVEYADEDIGSNCGSYTLKGGEVIEDEEEGEQFAVELWGYDYEEWKKDREADMA